MQLKFKDIDRDGAGRIKLYPENEEDMWHTYNLIMKGDRVRSTTVRRVQSESQTGSMESSRVRTVLTIQVDTIHFDPGAGTLRLTGRNTEENKFVKMGAFHTLDLELNRDFEIFKDEWDSVTLERITSACDVAARADCVAILMQEGLANVCLVMESITIVRQRIEVGVPRKRRGDTTQHDKGVNKFLDAVYQAIVRYVNFDVVKCVIIASPGFLRDQMYEYMIDQAVRTENKTILENRSKFILAHSSSGHKYALRDVLQDPTVNVRMVDTKAASEFRSMDTFYKMMNSDPNRAHYGYKAVLRAADNQAIDTLLVSDSLFRADNIETRKRYIELVELVKLTSGTVHIFSSAHVTGEQLDQLTGVAAILRFPMEEEDDDIEDAEETVKALSTSHSMN